MRNNWIPKEIFAGGYTLLPNLLLRQAANLGLKARHLGLITVLLGFRGSSGIFPSLETLAKTLNAGRASIKRWLRELENMGLIKIDHSPGRVNRYDLSPLWERIHKEVAQFEPLNTYEGAQNEPGGGIKMSPVEAQIEPQTTHNKQPINNNKQRCGWCGRKGEEVRLVETPLGEWLCPWCYREYEETRAAAKAYLKEKAQAVVSEELVNHAEKETPGENELIIEGLNHLPAECREKFSLLGEDERENLRPLIALIALEERGEERDKLIKTACEQILRR